MPGENKERQVLLNEALAFAITLFDDANPNKMEVARAIREKYGIDDMQTLEQLAIQGQERWKEKNVYNKE